MKIPRGGSTPASSLLGEGGSRRTSQSLVLTQNTHVKHQNTHIKGQNTLVKDQHTSKLRRHTSKSRSVKVTGCRFSHVTCCLT